jgi:4-amino-4-deoxy-L-arabinose transferase-like glycosyltransferase
VRRAALPTNPGPPRWAFWLIFALGLAIRLALLNGTRETALQIEDERHYHQLAASVVRGDGYGFDAGRPTSIRPPLYPALLAGLYAVGGEGNFQLARAVQIILSALNVAVLYRLGSRVFDRRVGALAALAFWLYPSFMAYDSLLLTEVLFTLLLTVFALGHVTLIESGRGMVAFFTGAALGIAALARSVLWPFPLILCPIAYFSLKTSRVARWLAVALLFLGYAAVVGPWAARNTRVQGVFSVVDTMGGINLMMGNYQHTPLARPWDAVSLSSDKEKSWSHELRNEHPDCATWSEGRREKWAVRKAFAYMLANPGETLVRSVVKFCDFWGLEREIIAGFQKGLYVPPLWFEAVASATITASYVALMLLASLGFFFARPADLRIHVFFAVVILFICGLHTLAFGHSRYHLPLVPILILYAASAVARRSWRDLGRNLPTAAFLVTAAVLAGIWVRELLVRDFDKIQAFFSALL